MTREQQVLSALGAIKPQTCYFTSIIISGMCFFTDAYDHFCISRVTKFLDHFYYHVDGAENSRSLPPNVSTSVKVVFGALAYEANAIGYTVLQANYLWQIILKVGVVLALLTYYWRT
ncbi:hypothetical protein V6N13_045245 [Hibiscus sabdariffa]|uniref:Uncharacterized protein n=1 Tax=Hibiscus sabdariffa TaxID=183260 RepID=A0ABR2RKJ8_9ROSI